MDSQWQMLLQGFYDDEEEAHYQMHLVQFSYNEVIKLMNSTRIIDKHEKVQRLLLTTLLWSEALNSGKGSDQTIKSFSSAKQIVMLPKITTDNCTKPSQPLTFVCCHFYL